MPTLVAVGNNRISMVERENSGRMALYEFPQKRKFPCSEGIARAPHLVAATHAPKGGLHAASAALRYVCPRQKRLPGCSTYARNRRVFHLKHHVGGSTGLNLR
jgi:hypothetical protein